PRRSRRGRRGAGRRAGRRRGRRRSETRCPWGLRAKRLAGTPSRGCVRLYQGVRRDASMIGGIVRGVNRFARQGAVVGWGGTPPPLSFGPVKVPGPGADGGPGPVGDRIAVGQTFGSGSATLRP